MDLTKQLEIVGLSSKEAIVYLALIKHGPIGGGDLAKFLHMDRTHTYNLIRNLIDKGLASHTKVKSKTSFQATSIKNLLNEFRKKEITIESLIPELESLKKVEATKPVVQVYEGKAGLRAVMRIAIETKEKEFLGFGASAGSYNILEYEMPHITEQIVSRGLKARIIASEKIRGHHSTKFRSIKMRYMKELTNTTTTILEEDVFIFVFEENPYIIQINSKNVANSYRKYFEYLWKLAKD